eukprot:47120_1
MGGHNLPAVCRYSEGVTSLGGRVSKYASPPMWRPIRTILCVYIFASWACKGEGKNMQHYAVHKPRPPFGGTAHLYGTDYYEWTPPPSIMYPKRRTDGKRDPGAVAEEEREKAKTDL